MYYSLVGVGVSRNCWYMMRFLCVSDDSGLLYVIMVYSSRCLVFLW